VLANGNVHGPAQAQALLAETGARGLMIGRGAIRNPWLFDQIRQQLRGEKIKLPTGRGVLGYVRELWDAEVTSGVREPAQVQRMKKFMNFVGEGVGGKFLHEIRRVTTQAGFFRVCEDFLDHGEPMTLEPAAQTGEALSGAKSL
jgi:tRNA-dihydrouridine synthase